MSPSLALLTSTLATFLNIYFILLIIACLLTWFNVDWSNPIFSTLRQLTEPYLNLFRSLIPPMGGIDFSPMLAIFLMQFLARTLSSLSFQTASGF
ncbi:MAG: YggT family protein [Leptolyngbyaceae bacterium]|nr:YggT family protein [Leptolyngbyaceae bacterium]